MNLDAKKINDWNKAAQGQEQTGDNQVETKTPESSGNKKARKSTVNITPPDVKGLESAIKNVTETYAADPKKHYYDALIHLEAGLKLLKN